MRVRVARPLTQAGGRWDSARLSDGGRLLLLRRAELGLAVLRKFEAALMRRERLFQGELSGFHAGNELFQLGQRGFEAE